MSRICYKVDKMHEFSLGLASSATEKTKTPRPRGQDTHTLTYIHTYTHTYAQTHLHIQTHTHTHAHGHTHTLAHAHIFKINVVLFLVALLNIYCMFIFFLQIPIIEYLDETRSGPQLLPKDLFKETTGNMIINIRCLKMKYFFIIEC